MAHEEITVPLRDLQLLGDLHIPTQAASLVLFAHGSGSSRKSPRNQLVARTLNQAGIGTLLFDLLTRAEEQAEAVTGHFRFDIGLLASRLLGATKWVADNVGEKDLNLAYFGSSTGAAAALMAAAELGERISAVVSRGGRPDLAAEALDRVVSPTLLIVGGNDNPVIALNEDAYTRLHCEKALRIVPNAGHLFEEPGKLEIVANMAAEWLSHCLEPLNPRPL